MTDRTTDGKHVIVIGAGGNIGSHLVPHLARMHEISRLTLIDRDRYEERNLSNQAVPPWAVGLEKATVQASLAHNIAPHLQITPIAEHVEDVPLGALSGDLLLTCVDSRQTRQYVNQAAFRLLTPWIDAGILADGLLARVDVFRPGADVPCMECGWSPADYAALEQPYPCAPGAALPAPSGGPSALGALAAALQALEARKQLPLEAPYGTTGSAEQIVIDASHHRHYHTRHRKNDSCRFCGNGAYTSWCIEPLPLPASSQTLGGLLEYLAWRLDVSPAPSVRIAGRLLSADRACVTCGHETHEPRLISRDLSRPPACERCGSPLTIGGFGVSESIDDALLSLDDRALPLNRLGLRDRDVLSVDCGGDDLHFEYRPGGRPSPLPPPLSHPAL